MSRIALVVGGLFTLVFASAAAAAPTVPTEIEQPGTQPGEVNSFATNCANCHGSSSNDPLFDYLPQRGWDGSMMSHAARDPLFWATVAIAEQDFLPDPDPALRGGVGDLCLRCHTPGGWLAGRSTPTDGSGLSGADERGVECEFCHLMVDPDEPTSIPGTVEQQVAPYEAFDPETGVGYYGSGQYVINSNGTRVGPYADATSANHGFLQSSFQRSGDMCGTCHDVSNPAVGDLAPNHGAQLPLVDGYSGVLGSPVEGKAAFNHAPYEYGAVERTYSEWKASALDDLPVSQFGSLPAVLQVTGGSLQVAHQLATAVQPNGNYADGTLRTFTCQTCHMPPVTGKGCNKNNAPVRSDLPWHDMTGASYWIPDAVIYQSDQGTLRFGSLTAAQETAMAAGQARAVAMLESAGRIAATAGGETMVVTVTNLTGHKLISGYPEGRRMWLNVRWLDGTAALIAEDGGYGTLARPNAPPAVDTLLDLEHTTVFHAEPGMSQEWAATLIGLGYDPALPLIYDRVTDDVEETLGDLAAELPGTAYPTFHFALNNVLLVDNRIPPYGFDYDEALERNTLPVPDRQYGARGGSGVLNHAAVVPFDIPLGAVSAEVRLYYQQTSWEYIQFLWLANDQQGPFLGQEGVNMLDAWLNAPASAPMSPPLLMTQTSIDLSAVPGAPGEASIPDLPLEQLRASFNQLSGEVEIEYTPACDATDQTIYYGDLAEMSSYAYRGAVCGIGNSGTASFVPAAGDLYFLVVGNNAVVEGSFGENSDGQERPEDTGTPLCDLPQDLSEECS